MVPGHPLPLAGQTLYEPDDRDPHSSPAARYETPGVAAFMKRTMTGYR